MTSHPTEITLGENSTLVIVWSDGQRRRYTFRQLRDACPCATCREKRRQPASPDQLTVLTPEETKPIAITQMNPVGQYAYSITFSDGHDTGIFTFEVLRELGEAET